MSAKLLGAHMPASKGLGNAIRNGKAIGCTAVQVFTSSPQMWYAKAITDQMVEDLTAARKETGISCVVSHDSYLINLCATSDELCEKSYKGLRAEIDRCAKLGIEYVVSHMGSHLGLGEEAGLKGVAKQTVRLLEEMPSNVILLMETTAGQGSALNYRFEHLATILDLCKGHKQLGVCLDTCHIFVAGYDIRTPEVYEKTFSDFERIVGLERLKVIHCNDSKKDLGSKVDRHEHIGQGKIGETAFKILVNDPRFENTPILLETPEAETMHQINLTKLWQLTKNSH